MDILIINWLLLNLCPTISQSTTWTCPCCVTILLLLIMMLTLVCSLWAGQYTVITMAAFW